MADNDKKYVPTSILDTYPHRAMRYAVLAPLVGSADYIEHDIPKMLALLRQQWTARISAMANEAKWKPAMGKGHYYLRNCPPFGVKTDDTFRRPRIRVEPVLKFGMGLLRNLRLEENRGRWGSEKG